MMKLEFASAICHDYNLQYVDRFSIDDTYKYYAEQGIIECNLVKSLIEDFNKTQSYTKILDEKLIKTIKPGLYTELEQWGFIAKKNRLDASIDYRQTN